MIMDGSARSNTADLLGAFEQAEIAVEWANRDYQEAAMRLHQAKPADRQQASYQLSIATKTLLRRLAQRDRLRAEIAHARVGGGRRAS
jgi:hypothetical protein